MTGDNFTSQITVSFPKIVTERAERGRERETETEKGYIFLMGVVWRKLKCYVPLVRVFMCNLNDKKFRCAIYIAWECSE